jgi:uncharacterized protein YdeI (BOF family)
MKKLLLAAAISALMLPGAFACEHGQHAANADRTTVACAGGSCQSTQTTSASSAASTKDTDGADEVAQDGCNGPNCERAEPTLISLRPTDLTKPNK